MFTICNIGRLPEYVQKKNKEKDGIGRGPLMGWGWGVSMSYVEFKKRQCYPVEFKK